MAPPVDPHHTLRLETEMSARNFVHLVEVFFVAFGSFVLGKN